VLQKERFLFRIDEGWTDQHPRVAILEEDALLTARWSKSLQVDPQRQDRELPSSVDGAPITKEQDPEMAPSFGPELIHLSRGGIRA
jgi:hypothetical protein